MIAARAQHAGRSRENRGLGQVAGAMVFWRWVPA
jgi:hypothetical protein